MRPQPVAGEAAPSAPILEHVAFHGSVEGWELQASLWGWIDATKGGFAGAADADTLTVSGALPRGGRLIVGRQLVVEGAARLLRLDGLRLRWDLPAGFRVDAFTGLTAKPRFFLDRQAWSFGARVSYRTAPFTEAGLSFVEVREQGWPASDRLGLDLYLGPWSGYQGAARAVVELRELRPLEVELLGDGPWGTLVYRYASPDLRLPRTSILSVFAAEHLHEAGGDLRWQWLGGGGRAVFYPGGGFGAWLSLRASLWGAGGELRRTWAPSTGGWTARAWIAKSVFGVRASGEAVGALLDQPVNGRREALAARVAASKTIAPIEVTALVDLSTGPYAVGALAAMVRVGWSAEWGQKP